MIYGKKKKVPPICGRQPTTCLQFVGDNPQIMALIKLCLQLWKTNQHGNGPQHDKPGGARVDANYPNPDSRFKRFSHTPIKSCPIGGSLVGVGQKLPSLNGQVKLAFIFLFSYLSFCYNKLFVMCFNICSIVTDQTTFCGIFAITIVGVYDLYKPHSMFLIIYNYSIQQLLFSKPFMVSE